VDFSTLRKCEQKIVWLKLIEARHPQPRGAVASYRCKEHKIRPAYYANDQLVRVAMVAVREHSIAINLPIQPGQVRSDAAAFRHKNIKIAPCATRAPQRGGSRGCGTGVSFGGSSCGATSLGSMTLRERPSNLAPSSIVRERLCMSPSTCAVGCRTTLSP
jgi:hypothetical protein